MANPNPTKFKALGLIDQALEGYLYETDDQPLITGLSYAFDQTLTSSQKGFKAYLQDLRDDGDVSSGEQKLIKTLWDIRALLLSNP